MRRREEKKHTRKKRKTVDIVGEQAFILYSVFFLQSSERVSFRFCHGGISTRFFRRMQTAVCAVPTVDIAQARVFYCLAGF